MTNVDTENVDLPKRVDDIISRQTANSSAALLVASAAAIFSKFFDIRIDQLGFVSVANIDRLAVDWAFISTISYLTYAHITNWNVDRRAGPNWFDMSNAFGDHPDSYGSGQWYWPGSLRGTLVNVWLHIRGAFGYSPWSWMMSLFFIKHLVLPVSLALLALVVLFIDVCISG